MQTGVTTPLKPDVQNLDEERPEQKPLALFTTTTKQTGKTLTFIFKEMWPMSGTLLYTQEPLQKDFCNAVF